jgi:cardiolipin synthase
LCAQQTDTLTNNTTDSIEVNSAEAVMDYLKESGMPLSDNNRVRLLKSGRDKFLSMFEDIRKAKHSVHL